MGAVTTLKFGIIGQGHIGKRHALMIENNPEAELLAVCDIRSKEELGLTDYTGNFYASVEEMLLAEPDLEVITVATPNGLHHTHALQVLEANKHVVIEKPMALTKAACESILFKALQMSKQVFCIMQNRYSPPSVWLKELIEAGVLGEIYMVQINCYWNRDDRYYKAGGWKGTQDLDGGTLFTQFSHFVDILFWLFGDIKDIEGKFADFSHGHSTDFEDSGIISFKLQNGALGSINYSTAVYKENLESSLTVIAEKGSVKVGGQYMNQVTLCNIKDYEMPELPEAMLPNDYGYYKGSAANHIFVFENVIKTLKGHTSISTNALEGLKVVEIIEKIYSLRNEQGYTGTSPS